LNILERGLLSLINVIRIPPDGDSLRSRESQPFFFGSVILIYYLCKMNKETIYNFLDEYVGEGANCSPIFSVFRTWSEKYVVTSNNETEILWFIVRTDQVKVYRSESLCRKIEGYFGIDPNESWKYIRDWFGDRQQIKVLSDLLKLIVKEEYGRNKV